jgi:hypothetical protein
MIGGKKSPYIQFRCPPHIRTWIEEYAVECGTNLTAVLMSLIVREKQAQEDRQRKPDQGT